MPEAPMRGSSRRTSNAQYHNPIFGLFWGGETNIGEDVLLTASSGTAAKLRGFHYYG